MGQILATEGYGEIIGGGQREESVEVLLKKLPNTVLMKKIFNGIWISVAMVAHQAVVLD